MIKISHKNYVHIYKIRKGEPKEKKRQKKNEK